jgi:hypothetical protein
MITLIFRTIVLFISFFGTIFSQHEPRFKIRTPLNKPEQNRPVNPPQSPAVNSKPATFAQPAAEIKNHVEENFALLPDTSPIKLHCIKTLSTSDNKNTRYHCQNLSAFLFCATKNYYAPHASNSTAITIFCDTYRLHLMRQDYWNLNYPIKNIAEKLALTPQKTAAETDFIVKIFQNQEQKSS